MYTLTQFLPILMPQPKTPVGFPVNAGFLYSCRAEMFSGDRDICRASAGRTQALLTASSTVRQGCSQAEPQEAQGSCPPHMERAFPKSCRAHLIACIYIPACDVGKPFKGMLKIKYIVKPRVCAALRDSQALWQQNQTNPSKGNPTAAPWGGQRALSHLCLLSPILLGCWPQGCTT